MKTPSLAVIFLTVFIDLVGFGLVLPLMPPNNTVRLRPLSKASAWPLRAEGAEPVVATCVHAVPFHSQV